MRAIATIFNIGLICVLVYDLFDKGLPRHNEVILVLLIFCLPIVNLIALFAGSSEKSNQENNWIVLYFKRKALEEQQKIKKLKDE